MSEPPPMLEPQNPGFTGTVWESRPSEQLARDLVTGAGASSAAEAGLAWGRLGVSFAATAVEYDRILGTLSTAWESENSSQVIERFRTLSDWLTSSATAAAGNAAQAESHALTYEIARLAMPDAQEVTALRDLQNLLESVGAAMGAPMLAKIAQAEDDADAAKAVAARVMRTYEAATERLATPWEHEPAPMVAPDVQANGGTLSTADNPEASPQAMAGAPGYSSGPINFAPVKTAYRGRTTTQVSSRDSETVRVQPVSVQQAGTMPFAPGMGAGHGGQDEEEHSTRSDLAGVPAGDAELGLGSGMQVAPAVLGGLDPSAQRGVPDIAFTASTAGGEAMPTAEPAGGEGASSP
ncbi:PPE domain-containing protein [Nocardia sp. NPDC058666]|uniref:PPE domain-containing protein n=1 Tax=unclassified Nocardia TaxID=2637762 RepID=UPI003667377A